MVSWELYPENEGAQGWDRLLLQARDYTVCQSYGWAEYKRLVGWLPLRYVAHNKGGKVVGMVQLLLKPLPLGFGMAWAPGGPALRFEADGCEPLGRDLSGLLADLHSRYPRVLVRFHSHIPHDPGLAYGFNQTCLRPVFKINSGYTIHMDLADIGGELARRMTSKHRYYVKKADAAPLRWESGSSDRDIAALVRIHREMVANKNIPSIATSEAEIIKLRDSLGAQGLTILTGYLDDQPVTSCLTFDFGRKSIYMVAATGNKGREVSAAYAMVARLIPLLQQKGIAHFDFGGIDPVTPAAEGVNHFKRGFGGAIVEYLGEWDAAPADWLRWGMNLAIWKRGGRV